MMYTLGSRTKRIAFKPLPKDNGSVQIIGLMSHTRDIVVAQMLSCGKTSLTAFPDPKEKRNAIVEVVNMVEFRIPKQWLENEEILHPNKRGSSRR